MRNFSGEEYGKDVLNDDIGEVLDPLSPDVG